MIRSIWRWLSLAIAIVSLGWVAYSAIKDPARLIDLIVLIAIFTVLSMIGALIWVYWLHENIWESLPVTDIIAICNMVSLLMAYLVFRELLAGSLGIGFGIGCGIILGVTAVGAITRRRR